MTLNNKLELLGLEGAISNYKRGRHTIHPKHCILEFPTIKTRKDANKLAGRTVLWISSTGKEMKGVITRAHGNSGAVRAHFKRAGLPGQALGTKIKIIK
jgi:ribosomal protein L35AE/L33A